MLWDSQARASQSLKPVCCRAQAQREEKPPLTTAGESPRAATDTQCSQKIENSLKTLHLKKKKRCHKGQGGMCTSHHCPVLPGGALDSQS